MRPGMHFLSELPEETNPADTVIKKCYSPEVEKNILLSLNHLVNSNSLWYSYKK
jgi:hypothetical protein